MSLYITADNTFVTADSTLYTADNLAQNRFWVGNSGNWSDTAHWSETSGGTGGASVPTSVNSVYFNADSFSTTSVVTIDTTANCLDLDFTGLDSALTLTNTANSLNIYGSLTLPTSNLTTAFSSTGYLYFRATTTGNTITSNGTTLAWNRIYFNGIGGDWTNQDNFSMTGNIYLANGTWTTNNKTIIVNGVFIYLIGIAFTLNLGSSIITCTYSVNNGNLGLTLNAGTSTFKTYLNFEGMGKTWYNVEILGAYFSNTGVSLYSCNNLTITGAASTDGGVKCAGNLIITNALTIIGNNSTDKRFLFSSTASGTQRTITAENILFSNINIRDINLAGNCVKDLSNITGGALDLGNNSNIRFSPSLKQKGRKLGNKEGLKKQGTSAVQIGTQIWTAKNYNESQVGSLTIPEVQNSSNTEIVVNGDFGSSSGWIMMTGWDISNGVMNGNNASSLFYRSPHMIVIQDRWYYYSVDISLSSGNCGFVKEGGARYVTFTSSGTYNGYVKGVGGALYFGGTSFTGTVDNLSFKLVGWSESVNLYNARIAAGDTVDQACAAAAMWCNYNNLQSNGDIYGKLYNYYAIYAINSQLTSINSDWRVPTSTQISDLITFLGGSNVAGQPLKELGLAHWDYGGGQMASNTSNFTALGTGIRSANGNFNYFKVYCYIATNTSTAMLLDYWYNKIYTPTLDNIIGRTIRLIKKT